MKPEPPGRAAYPAFFSVPTRWADNDIYGHVNNVQYYAYFDTAVNGYLVEAGALDIHEGEVIGLVVSTSCDYFAPVAFPDHLEVGLLVTRLGTSSVSYSVAIFRGDDQTASASGQFTHVYVDRRTHRPVPLPEAYRRALAPLAEEQR